MFIFIAMRKYPPAPQLGYTLWNKLFPLKSTLIRERKRTFVRKDWQGTFHSSTDGTRFYPILLFPTAGNVTVLCSKDLLFRVICSAWKWS